MTVKKEKCSFLNNSVDYLGHQIDASGIHPTQDKIKGILDAPLPQNVQQLRAFVGLLNYYGRDLATVIHLLNRLLCKDVKWVRNQKCDEAFKRAKYVN